MYEFFTASGNLVFSIAFTLLILIAVLEVLSTIFGAAISGLLDNIFPDFDLHLDPHGDIDIHAAEMTGLTKLFVWLEFGKVPMLITFTFFLLVFSLAGFGLQMIASSVPLLGNYIPWFIASPSIFVLVLPVVKIGNRALAKVWPKDESSAVSRQTFIGRTATIIIGTATHRKAAEGKLIGPKGRVHYVMIVADNESETFEAGDNVLLVGRRGAAFSAIESVIPNLHENK